MSCLILNSNVDAIYYFCKNKYQILFLVLHMLPTSVNLNEHVVHVVSEIERLGNIQQNRLFFFMSLPYLQNQEIFIRKYVN